MKIVLFISRVIAGSVLLVSGLVKANDTLGFSYKMEEYFSAEVLNMEFLLPYALVFSILVCVAEIVLGLALIVGYKIKITSYLVLLLTIFFAFLTFYSAYFDKVNDCGCFGDAIKFTPWQSFIKDIVLMLFILPVFVARKSITLNTTEEDKPYFVSSMVFIALFSSLILEWAFPIYFSLVFFLLVLLAKKFTSGSVQNGLILGIAVLLPLFFVFHTYSHLPIKDYRPYAIGKNIAEQMVVPEGVQGNVYESILVYRNDKTGEEKAFNQTNYPWQDSTWVWVSTENKLLIKGYEPPVHDFVISDADGYELQDDILAEEAYVLLIVSYDIEEANTSAMEKVNKFVLDAENDGIYVYGLTASSYDQTEDFKLEYQVPITFYSADETMLKTTVRSNPGVILLKEGTVVGKWHYNDLPEFLELKKSL